MRINDTLRKAAGLFMELDAPDPEQEFYKTMSSQQSPSAKPEPAPKASAPAPTAAPVAAPAAPVKKTIEQVVRDAPGPNLDEIKVPSTPSTPIVSPTGAVDYKAIYSLAGIPACAFAAEQMLDLLATLPPELPMETKRATVKVTVNAMSQSMGVNAEAIVADASRKLAALASFAQAYVQQADEYVNKAELEITTLEAEIARRRQTILDAKSKQAQVNDACHVESDRLDDVLEFFSLDVSPSKYAPNP